LAPQIKYIVGNEACERFSFYGMKGILVGYMTGARFSRVAWGMSDDKSTSIIHMFVSANYFMPLIGAWLSDKLLAAITRFCGCRCSTVPWSRGAGDERFVFERGWGSCGVCYGPGVDCVRAGGIKPCVSAFMGDQFKPTSRICCKRPTGRFTGPSTSGSFFSFLVIPWIANPRLRLGVWGAGHFDGHRDVHFLAGPKTLRARPADARKQSAGFFAVTWHALEHGRERKPGQGFWDVAGQKRFRPAKWMPRNRSGRSSPSSR
jgi:POT family proton-dependent oligopeptide transporter